MNDRNPWIVLAVGVLLSILLAVVSATMIAPKIQSQNQLSKISTTSQKVTLRNNEILVYNGQKMTKASVAQKSLGISGTVTNPAGFVFGPDNVSTTVDLYVDFGNKKSRDFLLMNQRSFMNLMERNKVSIKIHPVPQGSAFGVYAAESLAEASEGDTEQVWGLMMELMKTGTNLDTDKPDEIVNAVVKTANDSGFSGISERTIKSGHFASWMLSVGNDPVLKDGFGLPLMLVNGEKVDSRTLNMNNSDDVRRRILNHEE